MGLKRTSAWWTLFCLSPIFLYVPLSYDQAWPLVFVALVPWLLLVLTTKRGALWVGYFALFPGYYVMHREVGRVFAAYPALGMLPFVPALFGTAYCVRVLARRSAIPLGLLGGPLWAAGELVRDTQITPSWHRLATALHAQLVPLQVCDLGGMAALSLAIACTSGAVAAIILRRFWPETRTRHASVLSELLSVAGVWIFVASYGAFRLHESKTTIVEGPRVMVVQSDDFDDKEILPFDSSRIRGLLATTITALHDTPPNARPALIAWPESVLDSTISPEFTEAIPTQAMAHRLLRQSDQSETDLAGLMATQAQGRAQRQAMGAMVQSLGEPLLVGGSAASMRHGQWQRFNAAFLLEPGHTAPTARHDKMVLFFGYEWLPWSESQTGILRAAHQWLVNTHNAQQGWPTWIAAGEQPKLFTVNGLRFAVPICFETEWPDFGFYPSLSGDNKPDFWLQIANDWWGNHTDDVLRSVRFNVFRAVEARVTVARSGNAGFTGFVAPTGEVYGVVGGAGAARMPGLRRPELPLVDRFRELNHELARLRTSVAQEPRAPQHTEQTQRQIDLIEAQQRGLRGQIRALVASSRTTGASTERVRIDRRRSPYSRMRGTTDTLLKLGFWLTIVGCLVSQRRARRPSPS